MSYKVKGRNYIKSSVIQPYDMKGVRFIVDVVRCKNLSRYDFFVAYLWKELQEQFGVTPMYCNLYYPNKLFKSEILRYKDQFDQLCLDNEEDREIIDIIGEAVYPASKDVRPLTTYIVALSIYNTFLKNKKKAFRIE